MTSYARVGQALVVAASGGLGFGTIGTAVVYIMPKSPGAILEGYQNKAEDRRWAIKAAPVCVAVGASIALMGFGMFSGTRYLCRQVGSAITHFRDLSK